MSKGGDKMARHYDAESRLSTYDEFFKAGEKELAKKIMEVIGTHESKEWDKVLEILQPHIKKEE